MLNDRTMQKVRDELEDLVLIHLRNPAEQKSVIHDFDLALRRKFKLKDSRKKAEELYAKCQSSDPPRAFGRIETSPNELPSIHVHIGLEVNGNEEELDLVIQACRPFVFDLYDPNYVEEEGEMPPLPKSIIPAVSLKRNK